jgi:hypothetical protein
LRQKTKTREKEIFRGLSPMSPHPPLVEMIPEKEPKDFSDYSNVTGMWQWLIYYTTVMLDVVHCLRYI